MRIALEGGYADLERHLVVVDGRQVTLTPNEAQLLRYLAERPGTAVPPAELLLEVFGYAPGVRSRTATTTMQRLRKKVERDPSTPTHLHSDRGRGYRFEPAGERAVVAGTGGDVGVLRRCLREVGAAWLVGPACASRAEVLTRLLDAETLVVIDLDGAETLDDLVARASLRLAERRLQTPDDVAVVLPTKASGGVVLDHADALPRALLERVVAPMSAAVPVLVVHREGRGDVQVVDRGHDALRQGWEAATASDRALLRGLAVARGGLTVADAVDAGGDGGLASLARLARHGLVVRRDGRVALAAGLRRIVADHGALDEARLRHARRFAAHAVAWAPELRIGLGRAAVAAEWGNLMAALLTLRSRELPLAAAMVVSLAPLLYEVLPDDASARWLAAVRDVDDDATRAEVLRVSAAWAPVTGRWGEADRALERSQAAGAQGPWAVRRAEWLRWQGRAKEAVSLLQTAAVKGLDGGWLLRAELELGRALCASGDLDSAARRAQRLRGRARLKAPALAHAAWVLSVQVAVARGQWDVVAAAMPRAMEREAKVLRPAYDEELCRCAARLALARGDRAAAVEAVRAWRRRAVGASVHRAEVFLASLLVWGPPEEVVEASSLVADDREGLDPQTASQRWLTRARVHASEERFSDALEVLKHQARVTPRGSAWAWLWQVELGIAQTMVGDPDCGQRTLDEVHGVSDDVVRLARAHRYVAPGAEADRRALDDVLSQVAGSSSVATRGFADRLWRLRHGRAR